MSENKTIEPVSENTSEVKATDLDQVRIPEEIKSRLDNGYRISAEGICCAINTCFNDNKIDDLCSKCPHSQENCISLTKAGLYATFGTTLNDEEFNQLIEKIRRDHPLTQETLLRQKVADLELELREYKRFPRTLIGCNVRDCSFCGEAGCTREQIVLLEDGSCQDAEFVCDECKHKFYSALNRARNLEGEDKSLCDSCFNEDDFYLREEPFFQGY